ncbi:hypothetical protein Tco_1401340 [Tanacetum coccineum]
MKDEDEDLEEDEFEEKKILKEMNIVMEIVIEEDENEPEVNFYEEVDLLILTAASDVYEVGESSTIAIPREDGDRLLPGFMRRDIDSLFGQMVNFLRRLCGHETAHALVEKKGEAKDKFYGKLILDLGNEVRLVWSKECCNGKVGEKLENVKKS